MARFTKVTEFVGGNGAFCVRFVPIQGDGIPGYTHRVQILDRKRTILANDWLTKGARINEEAAAFYCDKHGIQ